MVSFTGSATSRAAPVSQSERITILDSLRGIAILGILLMNIPSFAMPNSGNDPSILNEFGTINFKNLAFYTVVSGRHSTGFVLYVVWGRYYSIYQWKRKKIGWSFTC